MLLEFSFANFLSFRDKVTISMVATALRDRKADIGDEKYSHKFFKIFKLSLYLHLRNRHFGNRCFATRFNAMRFFDRTEELVLCNT